MTLVVGIVVGVLLTCVLVVAWEEHRSPTFDDEPCLPIGACDRGERCAMHDSSFRWVAKGPRESTGRLRNWAARTQGCADLGGRRTAKRFVARRADRVHRRERHRPTVRCPDRRCCIPVVAD